MSRLDEPCTPAATHRTSSDSVMGGFISSSSRVRCSCWLSAQRAPPGREDSIFTRLPPISVRLRPWRAATECRTS